VSNARGRIHAVDLNADFVVGETFRWIEVEYEDEAGTFKHDHLVILVLSTDVRLY